jgi:hypothetical protein
VPKRKETQTKPRNGSTRAGQNGKQEKARAEGKRRPKQPPEEVLLDFQQTIGANVEMKFLAKELEYLVGTGAAVTTRKEVLDFVSLGRQVMDDLEKLVH